MEVLKTVDVDFYFCFAFPHVCGRLLQDFLHINVGISILMDSASIKIPKIGTMLEKTKASAAPSVAFITSGTEKSAP